MITFFHTFAKQTDLFESEMDESEDNVEKKLKTLCDTRWVQRHEEVISFFSNLICQALAKISQLTDRNSSSKGSSLFNSTLTSEFVVSLTMLKTNIGINSAFIGVSSESGNCFIYLQ